MSNDMIIYNTEDGKSKISLKLENGTVWLNQLEIAELFETTKQNVSKHIKAIFEDGELLGKVVVNYQLTTTQHGAIKGKTQTKKYHSKTLLQMEKYSREKSTNLEIKKTRKI